MDAGRARMPVQVMPLRSPGADPAADQKARKLRLTLAVVLNLTVLGYFKYANFFIDDVNAALQRTIGVLLPSDRTT